MGKLKIKLIKSPISRMETHKRTAKALGLNKLNRARIVEATPQVLGMINTIGYLLSVEEVD